jgi:hypothetical protein
MHRVDYVTFQIAAIDLAAKGVTLTVANVVAHVHMDPSRAEMFLDRMTRDGRLDLEVDEARGTVVYRVRGLSTSTGRIVPDVQLVRSFVPTIRRAEPVKSVTLAVALAALVPGIGLAYAAPAHVVIVASLIVLIVGNAIGGSMLLAPLFWVTASIMSALFGGLYAVRFNQEGHRAPLHP